MNMVRNSDEMVAKRQSALRRSMQELPSDHSSVEMDELQRRMHDTQSQTLPITFEEVMREDASQYYRLQT